MKWAQTESWVSAYSLAQSGMPAADAALLGPPQPCDLGPPPADALPRVQARLAELFGTAPERVQVTLGASGAMSLLAALLFRDASRVVTELPSYEPFRALPEFHRAELVCVRRRLEDGWRLDVDEVRRALDGARGPAHVFVCTPHNPTGTVTPAEDLVALAAAAAEHGGSLVSSEVYMEFAPPAERVHAFALAPNAFSIGSLTKAYGLGALRVGWILAGDEAAADLETLEDLSFLDYVAPPTPSLSWTLRALDHLPELLRPLRAFEAENKPLFERWLTDEPHLESTLPRYGLTAFPRVRGVEDTREFARTLAREYQVDVGPGEFFGVPGHVRVGFGVPTATLEEGLRRLSAALAARA